MPCPLGHGTLIQKGVAEERPEAALPHTPGYDRRTGDALHRSGASCGAALCTGVKRTRRVWMVSDVQSQERV